MTKPNNAPQSFHVMVKPRGALCNLDCAYCYYLHKARLYPGSDLRMSDETLETFTRQYIAAQSTPQRGVPEITFGWQGGEPLLAGLDFFRRAVELQERHRRPGARVSNNVQTNGVLLDDEWCRFFHQHNFLVGLSLDGPRPLHDAYRQDKGGQPSFEHVLRGLDFLKKHQVEFNVLTTVHAANAEHPLEVYYFLRDQAGAQFVQFIPIVQRDESGGVTARSVGARQYGEFLSAIFDQWVRRDVGRVFVQIFDVALAAWAGERPGLCVFEETCGLGLALEHNGDLYACDHFVQPTHKLGNIHTTPLGRMVGSDRQRQFGLDKRDALPRYCLQCEFRRACNGGCPKNRFALAPNGKASLNYLCKGYKTFFAHVDAPMRFMAAELRAGRAPANVMLHLAREEAELQRHLAQARRNDPCPCGSGRKFKRCCGRVRGGLK